MADAIELRIEALVSEHGYNAQLLRDFAEFVQSQPKPRKSRNKTASSKPKTLTIAELQAAVIAAFGCSDLKVLKKHDAFKLATAGRDLNFRKKDAWLALYREWVGVPESERHEEGATCINGIDILKNFRPWHVFGLDPKKATSDDINTAFRRLALQHHPDQGGDRQVFEQLQKMRDSLMAFR
ncbi:DnaJ domain-containing protein [Phormidium tenue FACHB-886]|nr:DnaJ domain-containing protein [Phormidium tenue FACHB-886]